MYHTIEFTIGMTIDLEVSRKDRLELTRVEVGCRRHAQIKPYVVETDGGFIEMADLFFDDGTSASHIPFACFVFVD